MDQPRSHPPKPTDAEIQSAYAIFHSVPYLRHNARRQEHLASLGLALANRSVLELGAGIGHHTTFFLDRGCSVVSTEPREVNCYLFRAAMDSLAQSGYLGARRFRLVNCDIDSVETTIEGTFEIVYCYGLLYHLGNPEAALETMSRKSSELLLLETCVSRGAGESINAVAEERGNASQAVGGMGCRPTRPWIFNRLKSLFPHVYVPRTQPAHDEFPLDWTAWPTRPLTRAVFIASRRSLANPLLLDYLPDKQTLA